MNNQTEPNDAQLDAILADMATTAPLPSDALLSRVMADAEQVTAARLMPIKATRPGLWAELLGAIGGWGAVAGLSTATLAGVWIGIAPPDALLDVSDVFLNNTLTSALDGFSPDFDSLLEDG